MARVEADAEARVASEPLDDGRELLDRPPDRRAGARGVLDQEPGRLAAALERELECRKRPFEARLEAGAEVRADVEDDAVGLDRAGDLHRVEERRDGLPVDLVVR